MRALVGTGGGGYEDGLGRHPLELVEAQGPVVERRGQAEAVLHQGLLAGAVSPVHAPELRDRHVTLVDDEQRVRRQVVEEAGRRLARPAPGEKARVVLDALAVSELLHHLDVETGALLEALGLQEAAARAERFEAVHELELDLVDGGENGLPRRHVVARGIDREPGHPAARSRR